ncbi:DegT/DnrJ/EryC1/StrS family aminotransferase [candidate division KSB1 bacterium]|nr:DegT/DnrJ/EryC1/StrS family aminotransferase [candidate division KSB1 bacterium]
MSNETHKPIPMLDLKGQYQSMKDEINSAIQSVLDSCQFIMGPDVRALEDEIAVYTESKFAIGCNSGTDALQMALMTLEVGPGDEIITTPFTFVATAEVVGLLGAKCVFVDILPDTYNINPDLIEAAITDKTKAIIPVHLFGQSVDMDPIQAIAAKHGIPVIEDAAQAIGATYKGRPICGLGEMACLSFFPSKNLGAYGDGGMIMTSDEKLADKLRMIRNHGSRIQYQHDILGVNSRLDTLQAAILRVRLRHLDDWGKARGERAEKYNTLLKSSNVITPITAETNTHVFHQYCACTEKRDAVLDNLRKHQIGCAVYYPIPLHLQPAFRDMGFGEGSLPIAERMSREIFALPIYPELPKEDQEWIVEKILEVTD